MKTLVSPPISFKAFKEVSTVSKYGNNGAYHVYFGYTDYRYKYRMNFHCATQEKALRAAYYLLFLSDEVEQRYVEQGEFKISIVCGNQANSFDAEYFTPKYLKQCIANQKAATV